MTTELRWLMFTAILAGTLWLPYVIGVNVTDFPGKGELFQRPPDPSKMQPWVHRSLRAHQNLLEQFLPFAVVVLVSALVHVSTPITGACVVTFFWLRVAHAIGIISGLARAPIRPLLYLGGWVAMLAVAWQVVMHASAG
jgi:uncharacterized MAPEG superfamily protein